MIYVVQKYEQTNVFLRVQLKIAISKIEIKKLRAVQYRYAHIKYETTR